jgi:hypothetical protein
MAAPTVDKAEHAPTGSYAKEVLPRVEDLAASYRDWLKTYVNDTKRIFGVYRPAQFGRWEIAFRNSRAKDTGLLRRCLTRYTFFPRTKVPSCTLPSESEAMLNDWAVVGTDLFEAMQQYKIIASNVADPESAEHPATASR